MAWENIITGYKLVTVYSSDPNKTVGSDWVFVCTVECKQYYEWGIVFKAPIYKKKNVRRK